MLTRFLGAPPRHAGVMVPPTTAATAMSRQPDHQYARNIGLTVLPIYPTGPAARKRSPWAIRRTGSKSTEVMVAGVVAAGARRALAWAGENCSARGRRHNRPPA